MKEFIQQAGEEVSIVIYDAPLPPKYFRFSKKFVRTLFVVVPVLFTLTLLGLFFWGLGSRIQEAPRPSLPEVISVSDTRVSDLENEIKDLEASNAQLKEKMSAIPALPSSEDPFLMAIKKPYGMQNFLNQSRVALDQFEFIAGPDKTALKFQIISANPETRVTGHVLVFMISQTGMMAYPMEANDALGVGIKYSMGEPFAVSRLRPTNAEFSQKLVGDSAKFVIYIFSREGDLLLVKETQTFKTQGQQ